MARRSDIDWESIESDYRMGKLSMRQIADKHKVAVSAITRKAKKNTWPRDLSKAVDAGTKAALIAHAKQQYENKAHENATESAQNVISGVDAAIQQRTAVITSQQKAVDEMLSTSIAQHRELLDITNNRKSLVEIAEMVGAEDPRAAQEVRNLLGVGSRATQHKNIIDGAVKLLQEQRKAYGIKDDEDSKNGTGMDELLERLNRTLEE